MKRACHLAQPMMATLFASQFTPRSPQTNESSATEPFSPPRHVPRAGTKPSRSLYTSNRKFEFWVAARVQTFTPLPQEVRTYRAGKYRMNLKKFRFIDMPCFCSIKMLRPIRTFFFCRTHNQMGTEFIEIASSTTSIVI